MMVWAVIIGMGLLVFLNRYVFLEPRLPVRLSSNARQFLGFAVPGMLTATQLGITQIRWNEAI